MWAARPRAPAWPVVKGTGGPSSGWPCGHRPEQGLPCPRDMEPRLRARRDLSPGVSFPWTGGSNAVNGRLRCRPARVPQPGRGGWTVRPAAPAHRAPGAAPAGGGQRRPLRAECGAGSAPRLLSLAQRGRHRKPPASSQQRGRRLSHLPASEPHTQRLHHHLLLWAHPGGVLPAAAPVPLSRRRQVRPPQRWPLHVRPAPGAEKG